MKLVIAIIDKRDIRQLSDALIDNEFRFTEIASKGGFLRAGNITLLLGVDNEQVDSLVELIKQYCHAREEAINIAQIRTHLDALGLGEAVTTMVGSAQIFIIEAERMVVV